MKVWKRYTLENERLEPENHLFEEKGDHIPKYSKPLFWGSMLISGCTVFSFPIMATLGPYVICGPHDWYSMTSP